MNKKVAISCLFLIFSTNFAYGYIDPGTGSYIIQLLIAALATILYAIKYFWKNIKPIFSLFRKKESTAPKKTISTRKSIRSIEAKKRG